MVENVTLQWTTPLHYVCYPRYVTFNQEHIILDYAPKREQ